jgi:hypothetical protein
MFLLRIFFKFCLETFKAFWNSCFEQNIFSNFLNRKPDFRKNKNRFFPWKRRASGERASEQGRRGSHRQNQTDRLAPFAYSRSIHCHSIRLFAPILVGMRLERIYKRVLHCSIVDTRFQFTTSLQFTVCLCVLKASKILYILR